MLSSFIDESERKLNVTNKKIPFYI